MASAVGNGREGFTTESRPLRHVMRGVWLAALRRNESYVVLILLGLYFLGAGVLRLIGIESEQTARFVAGLGLELGGLLATMLVIVMGARQIPVEVEQRTIYPVLAKPVTRREVLIGKGVPTWGLGVGATLVFTAVTLAVTPRLGYQQAAVLGEALVLKTVALGMLTALTFWLSLSLPAGVTMLVAGAVALLGGMAANWLGGMGMIGAAAGRLIPDFKLFEQFTRYVDGGEAMGIAMMAGLVVYGAIWTMIFAGLAAWRFERQAL